VAKVKEDMVQVKADAAKQASKSHAGAELAALNERFAKVLLAVVVSRVISRSDYCRLWKTTAS
jgi:hypothetical protein